MNGAECGSCGEIKCVCAEIKENIKRRRATELALDEEARGVYRVLAELTGWRWRILTWPFPVIQKLTDALRKYYWREGP